MGQLSILVVDDEPEVCEFLRRFLSGEGHFVRTISNPTEALDALRQTVHNVVLLDLSMPGVSGMELLRSVRELDPDIAAIIITGQPSVETASESIAHGVAAYLRKPFTLEELRAVLDRIARQKGLTTHTEADLQRTIGENIRKVRKARGLTLRQVSNRSRLSMGLLSKMERAESGVSLSSLFKVAGALDVKLHELVGEF
ncbi:MAG: response regulator [Planctomycetes bacterium]|nr:response regulator [Planctomycetota bacterium]